MWEEIALATDADGRHNTRSRFALALTHKDVWARLVGNPYGAAYSVVDVETGDTFVNNVIAHAKGVNTLCLYVTAQPARPGARVWESGNPNALVDSLDYDLEGTVRRLNKRGGVAAATRQVGRSGFGRLVQALTKLKKIVVDSDSTFFVGIAALELLPIIAKHADLRTLVLDLSAQNASAPHILAALSAQNADVERMVNRLDSLVLPCLPTAHFLRNATITRLSLHGVFPADLPRLPCVTRLCVDMGSRMTDVFTSTGHAVRSASCFPALHTLWTNSPVARARPYFATFLQSLGSSSALKQMEVDVEIVWGTSTAWPPGLDSVKLAQMGAMVVAPPGTGVIGLDISALASHPLTTLYCAPAPGNCTAREIRVVAPVATWAFPKLRHLDVRGVRLVTVDSGGALKAVRGVPLPVAPGAMPVLHTLLLGYADYDTGGRLFDVSQFAKWAAARRLAILLVERARLATSRDAAAVKADLAVHKPGLTSVHLHACSVDDGAAAAVDALVAGCARACRCGAVRECVFGNKDFFPADKERFFY